MAARRNPKDNKPRRSDNDGDQEQKTAGKNDTKHDRAGDKGSAGLSLYKTNPEYREKVKARARDSFRAKANVVIQPKLKGSPATRGIVRTFTVIGYPGLPYGRAETYLLSECSGALLRHPQTIKYWVTRGLIPRPILAEIDNDWAVYHRKEIEIIAKIISREEHQFKNIRNTAELRKEILVELEKFRRKLIDGAKNAKVNTH